MWDSHLKKNVPRPGGRRLVSVLGQRGSRVCLDQGVERGGWSGRRKKAGRSCRISLSELRIHSRALSQEVADGN